MCQTNTMKIQDHDTKVKLSQRLRRVGGQLRGLETMLEEGRDCREIAQQLGAAQAALQSFRRALAEEYALECALALEDPAERRHALRELVAMMDRAG